MVRAATPEQAQMTSIYLDRESMDIILIRDADGTIRTNVPWAIVDHSPDGYNWGYPGSGSADLALNILTLFLPPGCDGERAVCGWEHRGATSQAAYDLHQRFKFKFIAPMPRRGGRILGNTIREWIKEQGAEVRV